MSHRYKILFSTLGCVVCYCILLYYIPTKDRTLINLISVVGFLLSILGIAIAYVQILSIKDISNLTQATVKETEERVKDTNERIKESFANSAKVILVSDLSRKAAMINEIQGYLIDKKIEMSILRMKDLKAILISLRNQPKYSGLFKREEFTSAFDNFHINLDNLQKHHFNNTKIDLYKINKDMEVLSTLFLNVEHNIKKA